MTTAATLMQSARYGDEASVASLLRDTPDVVHALDHDGESVLTYVGYSRNPSILRMLLDAGADPRVDAVWRQPHRPQLAAELLPSYSILHSYARAGWVEGVAELIARGAEVSARSSARQSRIVGAEGATPLMMAAGLGRDDCVALLVRAGAEVNDVDADGDSVLFYAASTGHSSTVTLLLSLGADPDPTFGQQPGRISETPLIFAARCAATLGADVITSTGASPQTPYNEIVCSLIRAGADPADMYRGGYMLVRGWQPVRLSQARSEIVSGPGCYVAPVAFLNQLPWSGIGAHDLMQ